MAIDIGWTRLRVFGAPSRRHDRNCTYDAHLRAKLVCVARHVRKSPGGRLRQAPHQRQRRRQLVRLTRQQKEINQTPGGVTHADDLGAETAARAAQRFAPMAQAANESQTQLRPLPGRAPETFLMRARDRSVHAGERQLRLSLRHDLSHDLVPYAAHGPAAEPQIGVMPVAKRGGDRPPFRAIVNPPDNCLDRAAVVDPRPGAANVGRRNGRFKLGPLRVCVSTR